MRRMLALLMLLPAVPGLAAESYDACAGFIDTIPTSITKQGTWCLRKDLATSMSSGAAIIIAANNVTIDCNGFKLGGLGAGPTSQARGVHADTRLNATVRNCAIRGFRVGIALQGYGYESGGHLVEDNRLDQNLAVGIQVQGYDSLVQRNRIFDTGTPTNSSIAIDAAGTDIRDNTIGTVMGENATGILAGGSGAEISGNRIRNLAAYDGSSTGIIAQGDQLRIIGNHIVGLANSEAVGYGITAGMTGSFCRDNTISNFLFGITMCEDNGGNVSHATY